MPSMSLERQGLGSGYKYNFPNVVITVSRVAGGLNLVGNFTICDKPGKVCKMGPMSSLLLSPHRKKSTFGPYFADKWLVLSAM